MLGWVLLIGLGLSPAAAAPQDNAPQDNPPQDNAPQDNAAQVAGLFMQSCVRFTGNPGGLRKWARTTGLAELPPAGQAAFLSGAAGKVFDATNPGGKFVLVSEDRGACSAVAQEADGTAVVGDLEQSLRAAGIAFTLAAETDDSAERALRHREYVASQDRQAWQILVSIVIGKPGTAMLTSLP